MELLRKISFRVWKGGSLCQSLQDGAGKGTVWFRTYPLDMAKHCDSGDHPSGQRPSKVLSTVGQWGNAEPWLDTIIHPPEWFTWKGLPGSSADQNRTQRKL